MPPNRAPNDINNFDTQSFLFLKMMLDTSKNWIMFNLNKY